MACKSSNIFEGYKAVGYVTDSVPFIVRYVEKLDDLRIVTCVGRSFHTYTGKLKLIENSHASGENINVLASDSIYVFTACGAEIFSWKHGHKWLVHSYKGHVSKVILLLPFGPHLISVDETSIVKVWEIKTEEIYLELPFNRKSFRISAVFHPSTYVNKILFGSQQGPMQLWNIRTQQLIYEFKGWKSKIMVIEQAPAIDVAAIGLENGLIIVHNLKQDVTLMKFKQEWGSVLALSFRSDGIPVLVSSSSVGHIAIWDLEKRKLLTQMRDIHDGQITGCSFIRQEPLLVTSSVDNALRIWCFDESDGSGRLLYERHGHSSPPTQIRFHGRKGNFILSSGLDSTLRAFSILSERLNRNLGQASTNRKRAKKLGIKNDPNKLSPISQLSSESIQNKEWDDIAACHLNMNIVTTWNFEKMRMGNHKLLHKRFKDRPSIFAMCLSISFCGNFVTIGYNTGNIDRFNIQSGIHRASYGNDKAHDGCVTGIVSDSLNSIIMSGGIDKSIKFWNFKSTKLISTMRFQSQISLIVIHKESSLASVAFDESHITVIDLETRKIIRDLKFNNSRVTDMTFSINAKWLVVSFEDCSICTWDLSLGQIVDRFLVHSPCISLCMSPTGEFLATSHSESLGIYLWANLTLYTPVSLRPVDTTQDILMLDLPIVRPEEANASDDESSEIDETEDSNTSNLQEDDDMTSDTKYISPEQISEELMTLSSLPSSRWQNLLNLDIIKKRNKPKKPTEKPQNAPFFMTVLPGIAPKLDTSKESNAQVIKSNGVDTFGSFSISSEFCKLLTISADDSDYSPVLNYIKAMSPSAIETEIRTLGTFDVAENESPLLLYFMQAIEYGLKTNCNFELYHSYIALFFKIHGFDIIKRAELVPVCSNLEQLTKSSWSELHLTFSECLCIINFIRAAAFSY